MKKTPPRQLANLSHKGSGALSSIAAYGKERSDLGKASSFSVNFKKAIPPTRTYSAETCFLQFRDQEVHFVFGQYALVGEELDTAIAIRMHGFYAKHFLDSIRSMESPDLAEIARMQQISEESVGQIKYNPKHLAKLSGNIIQAAVSGYEVTLDFYQVSPLAVMKAKESGSLEVEMTPVARVDLRTSLFMGLVSELDRLEPNFPSVIQG